MISHPPLQNVRPNVLIVDDQRANLLAMTRLLAREPCVLFTADSGNAALALVLRHEFAVILLDVRMPEMDGYEVATLVRDHTASRPVPIIFLTAGERDADAHARGYASGAIDYLYKPVDEVQLLAKVRLFLELYEHKRRIAESADALRHSHHQISQLLNAVGEAIVGVGSDGQVTFANPAACRLLDAQVAELVDLRGVTALGLPQVDDPFGPFVAAATVGLHRCKEATIASVRGRRFPVEYSVASVATAEKGRYTYVLAFQEISQRLAADERLRIQASHDHLTALNNRFAFEAHLARQIGGDPANARPFALLFIDLDAFKPINDRFGHLIGDQLLKAVADRLRHNIRVGDVCARLGGDEFCVMLNDVLDTNHAVIAAQKLRHRLCEKYDCDDIEICVGASIGVALFPLHGSTVEALLLASDAAMYQAKKNPEHPVMAAALVDCP